LTQHLAWTGDKGQLKNVPLEKKWDLLKAAGLTIDAKRVQKKNILLIDDLYQSGTTMHFVAAKLRESGAAQIYGIALTKALSDDDNMS
jgi:predicted amidophosphoribosyltransferase